MGRFSSLTRIRQEVEQSSSRMLADAQQILVKAGTNSLAGLAGSGSGSMMFDGISKIPQHQEQYRHYRGWVYTAIKTIANRMAGQPFLMGRRLNGKKPNKGHKLYAPCDVDTHGYVKSHLMATEVEVLQSHEMLSSMRRALGGFTAWSLFHLTAASLMLTGKAFWWMYRGPDKKLKILYVPAHWVTFVYSESKQFMGYEVKRPDSTGDPAKVAPDEMLYFPLMDPADPLTTISPLQTQATAVAIDENIQMAQFRAFKNGIFPGVMIRVGKIDGVGGMPGEVPLLDAAQRRDVVAAVQALYGGVLNYNDPMILDALIEGVEKLTHAPQEMDFLDSSESVKKRIFQAFGVNPILTGQTDGANRAQAAVADGIFASSVINPMADMIGQVITAWLINTSKKDDEDILFWIEPARANDDELKLKEYLGGLTQKVVTPNEYRKNVLRLPDQTEEAKKEMRELMALQIMGKPNAAGNNSGGSPRGPASDQGNQRG